MSDWKERYMREVEGLNNEGNPIGGDPPSGLRHQVEALKVENEELKEDLQFVERWANHHGTKPNVTAQEALSCIQHYPLIAAITKSYKDGVIPKTRNPYAEIEALRKQVDEHKEWHMIRDEMRKALEAQWARQDAYDEYVKEHYGE